MKQALVILLQMMLIMQHLIKVALVPFTPYREP